LIAGDYGQAGVFFQRFDRFEAAQIATGDKGCQSASGALRATSFASA
jgi:hypothetical protein